MACSSLGIASTPDDASAATPSSAFNIFARKFVARPNGFFTNLNLARPQIAGVSHPLQMNSRIASTAQVFRLTGEVSNRDPPAGHTIPPPVWPAP